MSVNETKVAFYSNWDIDQLIDSGSVAVSSGATALASIDGVKDWKVQLEVGGKKYDPGSNSTNASTIFLFYSYVDSGTLYIQTNQAGTAHWYIFEDDLV